MTVSDVALKIVFSWETLRRVTAALDFANMDELIFLFIVADHVTVQILESVEARRAIRFLTFELPVMSIRVFTGHGNISSVWWM